MRTVTVTNTNGFVFGFVQDRVVMADREGRVPAQPHLTSHDWPYAMASRGYVVLLALKRLVAESVTSAVREIGIACLCITGRRLCRLPVLSTRQHARLRG